ncbi:MAG: serine hydrolase [Geminicoccaceae bacterium]
MPPCSLGRSPCRPGRRTRCSRRPWRSRGRSSTSSPACPASSLPACRATTASYSASARSPGQRHRARWRHADRRGLDHQVLHRPRARPSGRRGAVALTDPAGPYVGLVDDLPERGGHRIRMVDLATQSSGLRRELEPIDGVAKYSDASFAGNLAGDPLLFTPGTGVLYSNIGFDVLAMALSGVAGRSYAELLQEAVLAPLGLGATGYDRQGGANAMTGYDWNGNPMSSAAPNTNQYGASELHTTANDMVRYLQWNLDRFGKVRAEARAISHAAHLVRDGLDPVYGMDESGHMDAMGLGWVIMMPEGDRPLIIQKAGGADGIFSYLAFAPQRGVGVFVAINQFDFAAAKDMARMANDLIANLAPR